MVEQVDREAAYALWRSEGAGPSMPSAWEEAFACHRTASTAALTAERDALVARVAELEGALAPFAEQADARRNNLQGAICFPQSFLIAARKALHDPT